MNTLHLTNEILATIEPFVNEWVDSSHAEMRKQLEDEVGRLVKDKMRESFDAGQSSVSVIYNETDYDFDQWYKENQK